MTDLLFATLLTVVLACAGVWAAAMVDVGVEHWAAGRRDAEKTLKHPEVLVPPTGAHTVNIYDYVTPARKNPS